MTNRYDLTPHEVAILKLLADDHSTAQLSQVLMVREETARQQVAKVLMKLGADTEGQAVARAITERIIGPFAD